MLIPNHPVDERLSALASGDPDAVADAALSEHVASCVRCTDTVAELGALRASLAELPDLRPHRPLQLLPPVADAEPSRVDRVGGWARRFFAPVLTAGAALALVGLVGTTAPILSGGQAGGAPLEMEADAQTETPESLDRAAAGEAGVSEAPAVLGAGGQDSAAADGEDSNQPLVSEGEAVEEPGDAGTSDGAFVDERSIWPMVLFAGVALMIAAALLRWILAPRAG